MSKSEMTPACSGRTTLMCEGVRSSMSLALSPTASISLVLLFTATTVGSFTTRPWCRTWMSVLAVPRSMAISLEKRSNRALKFFFGHEFGLGCATSLHLNLARGLRADHGAVWVADQVRVGELLAGGNIPVVIEYLHSAGL